MTDKMTIVKSRKARNERIRRIKDIRYNFILDAAKAVFSEKGYHTATLDEIAKKAGFSKASLYNYFEDKEVLFLSLCIQGHSMLISQLHGSANDTQVKASAMGIGDLIDTIFKTFEESQPIIRVVANFQKDFRERSYPDTTRHASLVNALKMMTCDLRRCIMKCIECSRKNASIDSSLADDVIADYIGTLIRGIFIKLSSLNHGDLDIEKKCLTNFLGSGIGLKK